MNRRYTKFYGTMGHAAAKIAHDAIQGKACGLDILNMESLIYWVSFNIFPCRLLLIQLPKILGMYISKNRSLRFYFLDGTQIILSGSHK